MIAAEAAGHSAGAFPLLSALIFLPMLGTVGILFTQKSRPDYAKLIALLTSVMTGALSIWMLKEFSTDESGFQFVSQHTWIEQWGIGWHLGVDGISLFLVVLTGVLFPLVIVGIDPHHDEKPYLAWLLMLEAGVMGSFLSLDLFLFFLFFEIVLVPMYFLIGGWGYENREYAATKFYLYTFLGSAFMMVGLIATAMLARDDLGKVTFDLVEIAEGANFAASTGRWLFFGFAIAFAVKVPIFPLHTWLPDAHTQAPTAGSVVLAGVMLKLGTYGFLRFGLYLFPEAAVWSRSLWLTLAVIGIIYGAIAATMQKDLKRLVAYSSVAHLGFIVLGTFAFTSQAISGSVLQMINHGVSTGALFLFVGWIYERRKTRQIAELGGIQSVAPIFAAGFMIVMLSSIGVPGLNGFIGEYLILLGSFQSARWWTVVATAGVILAALYLLWAYQRVFHGEADDDNKTFPELRAKEAMVLLPFIAAIVFTGVYPKPLLDRIEPSVEVLVTHVEENSSLTQPDIGTQRGEFEAEHGDDHGDDHGDEDESHDEGEEHGE
ncbi:NADH-quinone oxidoreductase subunit M [Ilumatobacter coccineus]|uniref:NADH-quinone oxidoreductase subunit M n=1 Tax=Ilumatobacter coccineus (strain NBRC 103263 / KCTC 29153 / YM16-304) TaxID=1313172 RepID=A0A6C7E2S8_ILUCY|nr:NADH-quinone oxidoreductase subunit M [Ilumatobacter coccineus]BAN00732.1 NADH-quinone oxidoreductase subunit M [Ilumatobacter coccineus YM16-304]